MEYRKAEVICLGGEVYAVFRDECGVPRRNKYYQSPMLLIRDIELWVRKGELGPEHKHTVSAPTLVIEY